MQIKIITDSSCDIPDEIIQKYDIGIVPNFINVGEKSYLDGVDLSKDEFYQNINDFHQYPKTAAPGPESFHKAYVKAAKQDYDAVISIHVDSNLSTIFHSATRAAEISKIPVCVHDSQQLSLGSGLQIIQACKMAEAGESVSEILKSITDLGRRTYIFAVLDTLKYLYLSGRITLASHSIGSLLRIKPLMTFHKGKAVYERVRTIKRASERMVRHILELNTLQHVSIVHTSALDNAKKLYERVKSVLPDGNSPYIQLVTSVVGVHVGPKASGLVCVTN